MKAATLGGDGNYFLRIGRDEGEPMAVVGLVIVPRSLSLQVGGPGKKNLIVWNRPDSVEVRRPGTAGAERVGIRDVTRRVELAISLVTGVLVLRWLLACRRR